MPFFYFTLIFSLLYSYIFADIYFQYTTTVLISNGFISTVTVSSYTASSCSSSSSILVCAARATGRPKVRVALLRRFQHSYIRMIVPSPFSAFLTVSMMTFGTSTDTSEYDFGSVPPSFVFLVA